MWYAIGWIGIAIVYSALVVFLCYRLFGSIRRKEQSMRTGMDVERKRNEHSRSV